MFSSYERLSPNPPLFSIFFTLAKMGCFLGCFGASKDGKRQRNAHNVPPHNPNFGKQYKPIHVTTVAVKQDNPEKPINVVPESRIEPPQEQLSLNNQRKPEEQLSSGTRKKVTFDSNVKEYKHISVDEAPGSIQDGEKGVNSNCTKPGKSTSGSESSSTLSSLGSYPPNHRYQNCRESDDDEEELDYEVSDLDQGEDGHDEGDEEEVYDDEYCDDDDDYYPSNVQELSTGSCSSMESRTERISPEIESKTPGFNPCARDRAGYVHPVLNPVENTTQWKVLKAKGTFPPKQQKENSVMDPSFKQFTVKFKSNLVEPKNNNEVAVDASLSTWLISSEKTPPNKAKPTALDPVSSGASLSSYGSNSVRSQEERPILGALTVEELKQFSASSTPRKSPCRSPDEKPLVGTVGIHWNDTSPTENPVSASSFKGIPNTTSKYREDKRVNWHSTPFETRLERALNRGAAEAQASHRAC